MLEVDGLMGRSFLVFSPVLEDEELATAIIERAHMFSLLRILPSKGHSSVRPTAGRSVLGEGASDLLYIHSLRLFPFASHNPPLSGIGGPASPTHHIPILLHHKLNSTV